MYEIISLKNVMNFTTDSKVLNNENRIECKQLSMTNTLTFFTKMDFRTNAENAINFTVDTNIDTF